VAFGLLLIYVLLLFIRPMEWVSWMYQWPILDVVVPVVSLAWLSSLAGRRTLDPSKAPQGWLMMGFFVATLMSHVSHLYRAMAINTFQEMGKVMLIYFLIATLLISVKRFKVFIAVLIIGCLFMCWHGILQARPKPLDYGFGGPNPFIRGVTPLVRNGIVRIRAFGFFNDPNDLALILVVMLPFVARLILGRGAILPRRVLGLAIAGVMVFCIFLTNSRGGWLALGVTAIVYCYLNYSKKLGTVLLILALPLGVMLKPSRMETMSVHDSSSQGRVVAWANGNSMLKSWPLFGAGKDRYTEFAEDSKVAHNSFVHCYGELGLFGYFFWLALIIASLKDGRALSRVARKLEEKSAKGNRPTGPPSEEDANAPKAPKVSVESLSTLAKDLMAALAGYLAAGFFLSRTYEYPLFILFAMFAALRCLYERDHGPLEGSFARKDLKIVFVAVFVSIAGIYVLIRMAMWRIL